MNEKKNDEDATSFGIDNLSTVTDVMSESAVTNEMAEKNQTGNFSKATIATGVGVGVLLGSISTFMTSCAINAMPLSSEPVPEDGENVINNSEMPSHPDWSDGSMQIAASVNDEMSFAEAFSTARGEVGNGGAFEWHGNVYGTYTAEEWNSMTPEQQNDFQSHFAWSSLKQNQVESSVDSTPEADISLSESDQALTEDSASDQALAEDVASDQAESDTAQDSDVLDSSDDSQTLMSDNIIDSSQMEIIGTVVDESTGIIHGYVNVDGNDVMLSDVNGDQIFDVMASDVNHDGQISSDEQIDISGANIHVNDLESNSTGPDAAHVLDDDTPDYINDADTSNYDILG